jgi:serine/threonine-protein phosphatase PGAM5
MVSSTAARFAYRAVLPAAASFVSSWQYQSSSKSKCDAPAAAKIPKPDINHGVDPQISSSSYGMVDTAEGDFHGLFPKRQLWQPKVEYPLWDVNWDGLHPPTTGDDDVDRRRMRKIRKEGVTRHIILIRHGQYDEGPKEDSERKLTDLGRKQADYTGQRLREMIEGVQGTAFGPCHVKVVRVSNLARAKETADIIASHLPKSVEIAEPDPDLNEGRPAHNIPGGRASKGTIEKFDEQHYRIERAFRRYFYRAPEPVILDPSSDNSEDEDEDDKPKHEFEIIVCHANVVRYFMCRALQIPPEAWLRLCTFNCSLTYFTIRPTGTVSCRMLGDIGHLPYDLVSFSGHHGYNW